jgi:hypothetical protein
MAAVSKNKINHSLAAATMRHGRQVPGQHPCSIGGSPACLIGLAWDSAAREAVEKNIPTRPGKVGNTHRF